MTGCIERIVYLVKVREGFWVVTIFMELQVRETTLKWILSGSVLPCLCHSESDLLFASSYYLNTF